MSERLVHVTIACCVLSAGIAHSAACAADGTFVAFPENAQTLTVLCDGEPYLQLALVGWEPNWKYMGFRGEMAEVDGTTVLTNRGRTATGGQITATLRIARDGPRRLTIETELETTRDADLTYIIGSIEFAKDAFADGAVAAIGTDGQLRETRLPLDKRGVGDRVARMTLADAAGRKSHVAITPPRDVPSDGAARLVLAGAKLSASAPQRTTLAIDLPGEVDYYAGPDRIPAEPGFDRWYEFKPDSRHDEPSEIDMQAWLERPAGRHGRITRDGETLVYNDRPIRLWGLNLCYSTCAPEKELADRRARFYAKYGINAVRLHKYADGPGWAGIQSADSFVELDGEGLDRMDYMIAQFKKRGVYVKLSAHFGAQKLGRADKKYVPYLEEFGHFAGKDRIVTPHSAVHYSPELQDIQIRQMTGLLRHTNPYTGMTYAEDPAVAFVEIINEQSILFYSSMAPLKASPTLRRYVGKRFCGWLREKYGTHAAMQKAWGGDAALDGFQNEGFAAVGEHLDKDNILPLGNPWFWDPEQLATSQSFRKQRLLDTLAFLYSLQNEFYDRYAAAMRDAGYRGEIVSSNWQAGRSLSHFCNLHSDARIGVVDRHNYFGGGSGNRIDNATMLAVPGSGTLSAGMQQVADRPFMLSEWIHVAPNEWGVEGPAVIGAYGMGLQGWDVSFMFQNRDNGTFSERIGRDRWDVTAPHVLGVFPAVARHVLRGDVAQSELTATSFVHVPSLCAGRIGFDDRAVQKYDVKTFASDKVPAVALAVARCEVAFTDAHRETPPFDSSPFVRDGFVNSSTGQLRWKPGQSKLDGFFTIDTAATKAVVGFADGRTCRLGDVTIEPRCPFAAVYVTAQEPDRDLTDSRRVLVVAIARARNTGMKVFAGDRLIERGDAPVLMEPVKARIQLAGRESPTVRLLDHAGRRTDKTLPVTDGTFEIDGARDRTCYYLVEYR